MSEIIHKVVLEEPRIPDPGPESTHKGSLILRQIYEQQSAATLENTRSQPRMPETPVFQTAGRFVSAGAANEEASRTHCGLVRC